MVLFVARAQEFDVDQQYQQAMQNAKSAFEAKQYSQAVLFYREAQKIKPESLLPKYKIEDIRTIYIAKELDAMQKPQTPVKRLNKNEKKQQELLAQQEEEKAKTLATVKMNQEADKAKQELEELKISLIDIQDDEADFLIDSLQVNDIPDDREIVLKLVDTKENKPLVVAEKKQNEQVLTLEKRKLLEPDQTPVDTVVSQPIKKVEKPKRIVTTNYQKTESPKTMSDEEHKKWIESEVQKLKENYPDKKTVEEMDKPGKHITRIIMHIDNKVSVYLKVKHSWGATYFFMDEVGQELRSINEQYFNLMTNLKTYGN
jgi:hypothetical protein